MCAESRKLNTRLSTAPHASVKAHIAKRSDWERDPSVAYNIHQNEFYVTYAGYVDAGGFGVVKGQRIQSGTGSLLGGPTTFIQSAAIYS